jgi:hypothetical protein
MPTSVMVSSLNRSPLATVEVYDATVFSASRTAFPGAWIGSPGHIGHGFNFEDRRRFHETMFRSISAPEVSCWLLAIHTK